MSMTRHAVAEMAGLQLGRVADNLDPDGRGRVKVRLLTLDLELWASVTTLSAGSGYGVAMLPRVDEIVVLGFLSPELPVVLGSLWSGASSLPSEANPEEDHYLVKSPAGTVLVFDDADGPKIEISTPQGYKISITDGNGGEILIERGGQSVKLSSSEIAVQSSGTVSVQASQVKISAGMVQVDAGMSKFSGVVQADTVIANAVVGTSYTPGAGNIW